MKVGTNEVFCVDVGQPPRPPVKKTMQGYLSTKVQKVYPRALVFSYDEYGDNEEWWIEFPFEKKDPIRLGDDFGNAKNAVLALVHAAGKEKR